MLKVQDLILLMAKYEVTLEDESTVEFEGTAFMMWTGLREFLHVAYPNWIEITCFVETINSKVTIYRDTTIPLKRVE